MWLMLGVLNNRLSGRSISESKRQVGVSQRRISCPMWPWFSEQRLQWRSDGQCIRLDQAEWHLCRGRLSLHVWIGGRRHVYIWLQTRGDSHWFHRCTIE